MVVRYPPVALMMTGAWAISLDEPAMFPRYSASPTFPGIAPGWANSFLVAVCAAWVLLFALGGCAPQEGYIDHWRNTRIRCPLSDKKVPCEYGPDGLLYQYPPPPVGP